ncbi:glyoxylate/hydroxypyruvate reductase A [Pokkaliibacter sp. MBI-7]|uniref:2-hydroxyacid dehydrogenase n=1 Tax=Pokkaliibacter sp. MBI-7 TaxID=3040600 RepID=UPI00244B0550|nr:glyoxylate/hydroxypyruvate reductase A [Pokkaliibacter sp. MBI-7]MDH2432706.1 glyoxylate/hydroxypyruvate reductase A [Pokkaliibacter sp. MBI-7]
MSLLYKSDPVRGQRWQQLFAEQAPEMRFHQWPECQQGDDIRYLVAWELPDNLLQRFPRLEVLFAVSAGVDQLNMAAVPAHIPVVRMLDPGISRGMVEYACFAVMSLHRDMLRYRQQQQQGVWQSHPLVPASRRRIGVMGLGQQGQNVLNALQPFGFPLSAWSRRPHQLEGVSCYAGEEQLGDFLAQSDILLCLLPLTPATEGILSQPLFDRLPRGAALINMGRGGHLQEQDLLAALNSGQLSAAVLDVLQQEPASADHPFWQHPQILLTPHIAAATQPDSAFEVLLANIRRYERGEPMLGVVDREEGY